MPAFLTTLLVILLLSATGTISAQKKATASSGTPQRVRSQQVKCELTDAPKLRGFYLGQSVEDISRLVPGFREAYEIQGAERNTDFPLSNWTKEIDLTVSEELDLVYLDSDSAFGINSHRKLLTSPDFEGVNILWWFKEEKVFAYAIYYSDLELNRTLPSSLDRWQQRQFFHSRVGRLRILRRI